MLRVRSVHVLTDGVLDTVLLAEWSRTPWGRRRFAPSWHWRAQLALPLDDWNFMQSPRNVLVLTADSVSDRMAGPAIRALEIAKALSEHTEVRLASTVFANLPNQGVEVIDASAGGLRPLVQWADVIVFQGHILHSHPWIGDTDKILIADIYDPLHLEQLEQGKELPFGERMAMSVGTIDVMNQQIMRADFMVCASEKQRDFWLGQLAAMGRINPATYDQDSSLRSLIGVVPFGVQDEPPVQARHAIKGAVEGIGADDKVVLWGGGIYNWFDPLSLIRAIGSLAQRRPEVKLFFLGVKHPNPNVPAMRMASESRDLAEQLGLVGTSVFFNEGWVPYEERADFLLDADVGASTHLAHLETAFSFRTRILDYFWCSLPVVSTEGDTFAEIIERHRLGRVVPYEDVPALESALEALLFDEELATETAARVAVFAESIRWRLALVPLIEFCLYGERAPDLAQKLRTAALARIAGLEARIDGLEASFSWRMTAPLRAVSRRLRRRPRDS